MSMPQWITLVGGVLVKRLNRFRLYSEIATMNRAPSIFVANIDWSTYRSCAWTVTL